MGVDRSPHIKSMIDRFLDQHLKAALADGSQLHIFPVTVGPLVHKDDSHLIVVVLRHH